MGGRDVKPESLVFELPPELATAVLDRRVETDELGGVAFPVIPQLGIMLMDLDALPGREEREPPGCHAHFSSGKLTPFLAAATDMQLAIAIEQARRIRLDAITDAIGIELVLIDRPELRERFTADRAEKIGPEEPKPFEIARPERDLLALEGLAQLWGPLARSCPDKVTDLALRRMDKESRVIGHAVDGREDSAETPFCRSEPGE